MRYYSYEDFTKDVSILYHELKSQNFDSIVAIARGGLTLAHFLSQKLNIRTVQSIGSELYDNDTKRDKIKIIDTCDFDGLKKVLVVDDIADSGETLSVIMKHLENKNSKVEFVTCTLFYKKTSTYKPTHWVNEADDWIDFFWENSSQDFTN